MHLIKILNTRPKLNFYKKILRKYSTSINEIKNVNALLFINLCCQSKKNKTMTAIQIKSVFFIIIT